MDSNSSSYLVLLATVVFFFIVFFFLSGMKRKPKSDEVTELQTLPFEMRSTHIYQLLAYLWFPLLMAVPILIFKDIHPSTYFVCILMMMVVLLSWFIAAQHVLEKDDDEKK